MERLRLFSPAKINLFLRVLSKRADGYYNLASLFQAIDLGDWLTLSLSETDRFTCSDLSLENPQNLVCKARDLFRQKTGISFSVSIYLDKKIPMEAGLGGGSSNAATTLWALNQLLGKPATVEELSIWAGELGSDLSFFFSRGSAYCTSRGEIVQSVSPPPLKGPFYFVKPSEGLSTKKIFQLLDLNACSKEDPLSLLERFKQGNPLFINDLEMPAFAYLPKLMHLKHSLKEEGYDQVSMTGSGTGFFCLGTPHSPKRERCSFKFIQREKGEWY